MEPCAGEHGRKMRGSVDIGWRRAACRRLGVALFDHAEAAVVIGAAVADAIQRFNTLDHVHRERQTGDPGLSCQLVGKVEFGRRCVPHARLFVTGPALFTPRACLLLRQFPSPVMLRAIYRHSPDARECAKRIPWISSRDISVGKHRFCGAFGRCKRRSWLGAVRENGENYLLRPVGAVEMPNFLSAIRTRWEIVAPACFA